MSSNSNTGAVRRQILALFNRLQPSQLDDLVFLIEMPVRQQPPNTLPIEQRKTYILRWAEQEPDGFQNLLLKLQELIGPEQIPPPPLSLPAKCKILFLASNPTGTTQLALDEECREIEQKIRASQQREALDLITKWAVRPDDLLQYLNQHRPNVVHFSGHGSQNEEIILLDANRMAQPVSKAALKQLFLTLKDNIRVVVLNACFSRPQAEAVTEVIDCAIGMKRAIGDQAAITFAASFYSAIGFGRSIGEAFEQGTAALMLHGIPEENTPELLVRQGIDAKTLFLIESPA